MRNLVNILLSRFKPKVVTEPPELLPLYPKFIPEDHDIYVHYLGDALKDDDIHNIALTGSFGSGKSSILKDFAAKNIKRTISISFSTLGANIKTPNDISTPAQDENVDFGQKEDSTSLIQKEIVKQILYREKYNKVPTSRFHRIYKVSIRRRLIWSIILTVLVSFVMYALGRLSFSNSDRLKAVYTPLLLVFIFSYLITYIFLPIFRRLQLEKVSGGGVSISDPNSTNYFDQYLDEIVYFFEATSYDIVILEDIDRFDNLYIFENLRQLNKLLNSSKQVNKKNIRFIFAVKDSIFPEDGSKHDENRTKFFDLIIPIVPFITHRSSGDLLAGMFAERYDLDRDVIALISKYITDMRLIKNISNEFKIFHKRIIEEGKITDLSSSNLFSLIVYKNKYLEDFELIRIGESRLDAIYQASRKYIEDRYGQSGHVANELRAKINSYDDIDEVCKKYSRVLIPYVNKLLDDQSSNMVSYAVNGKSYDRFDQMQSKEFWLNFTETDSSEMIVTHKPKAGPSVASTTITITKPEIETLIGTEINTNVWLDAELKPLKDQLKSLELENSGVRSKTIQELIQDYPIFNSDVQKLSSNGLLYELISNGYIDANYVLYTSIYREEMISAKGMNFIVHTLQANKQDIFYSFDSDDEISKMLNEIDPMYLEDRNIYNIDILNFLLKSGDKKLKPLIKKISSGTPKDLDLINSFIENKGQVDLLFAALSKVWSEVFDFIVSNETFDDKFKNRLINIVLENASPGIKYNISHQISDYLSKNLNSLKSIKNNESKIFTEIVTELLSHFNVEILSLNGIKNKALLKYVEINHLFDINKANLSILIDSKDLSLSNVKKLKPKIFELLCAHLDIYVGIFDDSPETKHSVNNSDDFVEVLNKAKDQQDSVLSMFIEKSSDECLVLDINEVEANEWPLLFANYKVVNTYQNVIDYYATNNQTIDDTLVDYLNTAEALVEENTITEPTFKKPFSVSVLNSNIQVETKINIVRDIKLDTLLKLNEFDGQNGDIYGRLVEAGIIEDSAITYNNLVNLPWETREHYILKSSKFDEYIESVSLSSDDINGITSSNQVKRSIKSYILKNAVAYKDLITVLAASNLATFVIQQNIALDSANLEIILDGISDELAVHIIHISLPNLTRENILSALVVIGGEYEKLSQPNKRPSIINNDHSIAIVKRLTELGVVSSFEIKKGKLKTNIKASW